MKKCLLLCAVLPVMASCGTNSPVTMTKEESALINAPSDTMRILTVESAADLEVLRRSSVDFSIADLESAEFSRLADKLVTTLGATDGGVGLAAPQVGINRRVVAVQRVDKEGEPVEVYANIAIEEFRGDLEAGPEGCLSVPDERGDVLRYQDITVRYTVIDSESPEHSREVHEDVSGFAAVIFQHEVDHLDGVLYIDKKL